MSSPGQPAVAVVVAARDAAATLPALLDALTAQDLPAPFEVLVADDGSRDATRAVAVAHPVVTGVVDAGGRGPGAARNAAAAHARAPMLAFTDADCVPSPGWLRAGVAAGPGVVQGRVEPLTAPGPFDRTLWVTRPSGLWETANLFVPREAFERAGGFAPVALPRGAGKELGEDAWLGWRLVRAGVPARWAPDALVRHAVEPRGAAGFVAERARLRFFPGLVARMPELRRALCWRRAFLSRRSAAFDVALAAALGRRPLGVLPWLALVAADAWTWGPKRALAGVAADAVGCLALVLGSARSGRVLL